MSLFFFQPTKWGNAYFKHLIEEEWVQLEEGPGGHHQVGNTIRNTTRAPAVLTNTKPPNLQWVVPNGKAPMAPKAHGGGEEEIGMLTRYFSSGESAM